MIAGGRRRFLRVKWEKREKRDEGGGGDEIGKEESFF
jgi:hypothetical protein